MKPRIENSKDQNYNCEQCNIGVLHSIPKTFLGVIENELISIPDFPIWKCDICGAIEYDTDALTWVLETMGAQFFKSSKSSSLRNSLRHLSQKYWIFWQG